MDSNYSLSDLATATGNNALGGGGEFMWIFALLILLFGGGFSGFGGGAASALTQSDLQRAIDLNSIQNGQRDIEARVQEVGAEGIGAIKDAQLTNLQEIRDNGALITSGNANIINALTNLQSNMQNCCCETKQTVLENRYLDSQNASQIMANSTANAQKILDALAQNKIDELQSQVSELKTQNMFCGIPRINPYGYGVYPYATNNCGCGNI